MKIKIVVCDCDGVILNSWPTAHKIIKQLRLEEGFSYTKEDDALIRRDHWGLPGHSQFVKIVFPGKNPDKIYERWIKLEDSLKNKMKYFDGFENILCHLRKRKVITGLFTNRKLGSLERWIKIGRTSLLNYFDIIQTTGKTEDFRKKRLLGIHFITKYPKPDPRGFNQILNLAKMSGIDKKQIVYIGDTLIDKKAAFEAGINFIGVLSGPLNSYKKWLLWGGHDKKFVIPDVTHFLAKLEELERR